MGHASRCRRHPDVRDPRPRAGSAQSVEGEEARAGGRSGEAARRVMRGVVLAALLALALGNTCATAPPPALDLPEARERAYSDPEADAVRHVVERRCMICHACYD